MDHEMHQDPIPTKSMPQATATDPAAEEKKKQKMQALFKNFVS
jgi:hypothetical protein